MARAKKRRASRQQVDAAPATAAVETDAGTAPAAKTKKDLNGKREPKNVRARMADVVIRITVPEGVVNPYREGSDAAKHFDAMKGGITVREYLSKFSEDEQRTARQWLWNTTHRGYAKTLGG